MTDTKWHLQGRYVEFCNCDHGCPCEGMAPPTQGHCTGFVAMQVDEGYFGDVRLDGIPIVATFYFPRAMHHCDGHMQPILPDTITDEQRDSIFTILSGEGAPVGTIFNVFSIVVEHHHDPIFSPITFDWDIKKRTCKIDVPGVVRAEAVPIRNPVTDEEVHLLTVLPKGLMFYEGDVASGTTKSISDIKFDLAQSHSSLAFFAYDNGGMAFTYEESKQRFGLDNLA